MDLTRRDALGLGSVAVAVAVAGSYLHGSMGVSVAPSALAETSSVDAAIAEFVGDAMVQTGRIQLKTPEIAENGNTVPVSFVVDSPMTEDDYVATVMLFADSNPWPSVAKFNFSTMNGKAEVTTRIRLARTQNVIAVAKMSDGRVFMDKNFVKVTVGGCGS